MPRIHTVPSLVLLPVLAGACMTPSGDTLPQKKGNAVQMKDDALAELYEARPRIKTEVDEAVGYAVFSNKVGGLPESVLNSTQLYKEAWQWWLEE